MFLAKRGAGCAGREGTPIESRKRALGQRLAVHPSSPSGFQLIVPVHLSGAFEQAARLRVVAFTGVCHAKIDKAGGMIDCINVGGEVGLEEGLEYESAQFGLVFSTADMREGTAAFLERRKPAFRGE